MKRSTGISVVLVWLAFAVRVLSLASRSVWWDEAFTWQTTSHGWTTLWHMLQSGDRNPPLYFVLTALWGGLGGWSEFSLRFVPLACGLIGLALMYALARRLFGRQAGVWTLLICAAAPALVVYSQEARMYALFLALTAALLYFAVRSAEHDFTDRRAQTTLLVVEAALLLTHYFAVPLIAALNVLVLVYFLRKRALNLDFARWLIGQLIAALPLIIWTLWVLSAPDSLIQAAEQPPALIDFVQQVIGLWVTGARDLTGLLEPLVVGSLIVIGVALFGAWQIDRKRTGWLVAFGSLALTIGFALTQMLTAFHPRYLLAFSVPVWVLIGAGLSQVKVKWLAAGLMAGALAIGWGAALNPAYARNDARNVAAYLKANATADDVILTEANDYTLDYYDHGPASSHMITAATDSEALTQLQQAVGESKHVWLVHWAISTQDTGGYWRFLLEQAGRLSAWQTFQGYNVFGYDLKSALVEPDVEHGAASLTSVDAGAVTLIVDWPFTNSTMSTDWKRSSIALIDQTGRRISSIDADLRVGRNYAVLPIPWGTPPITHTVSIKFYNAHQSSETQVIGNLTVPRSTSETDPYRTLSGYHWQTPTVPIANLEAYSLAPQSPAPLGQVDIILRWRKTTSALDGRVRLVQADRVWAEIPSDLLNQYYPFVQWAADETVLDRRTLIYPPVRGATQLQIAQDGHWLDVATLSLDESQLKFDPPPVQHTQAVQFGGVAELLGYDLKTTSIAPDRTLDVTLYWRAKNVEPLDTACTVFTQLIAPDGHLVAQHDAPPDPPTPAWVPGQIVVDTHALNLIDTTYRGPATLIVGWYNSASVVRVPASTGGDFARLDVPIVVEDR